MKKGIYDCATKEYTEVDMTPEELAEYQAEQDLIEQQALEQQQAQAELEALKASAKQKLISGEPLTEAEADTLVL